MRREAIILKLNKHFMSITITPTHYLKPDRQNNNNKNTLKERLWRCFECHSVPRCVHKLFIVQCQRRKANVNDDHLEDNKGKNNPKQTNKLNCEPFNLDCVTNSLEFHKTIMVNRRGRKKERMKRKGGVKEKKTNLRWEQKESFIEKKRKFHLNCN